MSRSADDKPGKDKSRNGRTGEAPPPHRSGRKLCRKAPSPDDRVRFADNLCLPDWIDLWRAYSQAEYSLFAWKLGAKLAAEGIGPSQVARDVREAVASQATIPYTAAAVTKWLGKKGLWGNTHPEDPRGERQLTGLKVRMIELAYGGEMWWSDVTESPHPKLLRDCRHVRVTQFIRDEFMNRKHEDHEFNRADLVCLEYLLGPMVRDLPRARGDSNQGQLTSACLEIQQHLTNAGRYPYWSARIKGMKEEEFLNKVATLITRWAYSHKLALETFPQIELLDESLREGRGAFS